MIELTERTIYPEIISFLKDKLGIIVATSEIKAGSGFVDIFFRVNNISFILEIKIGGNKEFIKAMGQVFDYAGAYKTSNAIILVYPEEIRKLKL
jgi:hypothetical protein